jgi:uncharacterized protein
MNYGLLQRDLDEILQAFVRFPEIEEAILFGSRAKGNYKPGSDVDLAIKGAKIDHQCVATLSSLLNEETLLPYYFDIVHYENITEIELRQHIDRVGKVLYRGVGSNKS